MRNASWPRRLVATQALACFALTSCLASADVTQGSIFQALHPMPVSTQLEIMQPQDGAYGGKAYFGSGRAVAQRVQQASQARFPRARVSTQFSATPPAPGSLRIEAVIHQWEDRATNWSGVTDKIRVQLSLYDAISLRRTLTYSANSSFWTFVNSPPEVLLDGDFDDAVLQLLPEVVSDRPAAP